MTVEFEIAGQTFVALNGGPHFKFNEAVSFQVHCETQEEIDYFWSKLSQGGQEGPLRLAEGQVRRLLAGRPGHHSPKMLSDARPQEVAASDQGLPADEEVRHRRARAGVRRRSSVRHCRPHDPLRSTAAACTRAMQMLVSVAVTATDTHHAIEAVFRIEQAKLIAGLARMVRDVGAGRGAGAGRARRRARAVAALRHPRQARRLAHGHGQASRARPLSAAPSWSTASTPSWGTSWPRTARRRCPTSTPRSTTTSATTCCG